MGSAAPYSVIIPAHNESRVIARLLNGVLGDFEPDDPAAPDVIVVCNGCSDNTAQVAREAAPACKVIELAQGSKPMALNTGNKAATAIPRFFVDADILVTHRDLAATAAALKQPGICAAAPSINIELAGCSTLVRSYYKVWQSQPYVGRGLVGSGIYGLSEAGLATVGTIPNIIADDGFVRSRFSEEQRHSVTTDAQGNPVAFTVFPPRDLWSLISIEARRRMGDAELNLFFPSPHSARTTSSSSLLDSRKDGASLADIAAYTLIKLAGRMLYQYEKWRGQQIKWRRDESSRT